VGGADTTDLEEAGLVVVGSTRQLEELLRRDVRDDDGEAHDGNGHNGNGNAHDGGGGTSRAGNGRSG